MRPHIGEYSVEHRLGQNAGVRVVAGTMVAVEKDNVAVQAVPRSVPKTKFRFSSAQRGQDRVVGDPAQRNDGGEVRRLPDGRSNKAVASLDFGGHGLVLRRHAPDRVGNAAIVELEAVRNRSPIVAVRKVVFQQRRIEEVACEIAREWSPGAICTLEAWRQSNDQKPRRGRPE